MKIEVDTTKTAVVIDDHPLVARGIADFLKSHCGFTCVHTISSTADFWAIIGNISPVAMIVLDFWLPDGASLALLGQIRARHPSLPVLIMSADDDLAVQDKVQAAGAHGFINKQEPPEIVVQAVMALLNNQLWFKKATYPHIVKELVISAAELGLTARQGEILAMIMQGLPNKRIAQALNVSEQTVKEHVSGILERMGVHNRIEAITKLRGRKLTS